MALEKWHPLRELESMRKEMDRIWEGLFPAQRGVFMELPWLRTGAEKGSAVPAIDIIDSETEVIVKAEMPGVGKDDLELSLHESTLTIKGAIKEEPQVKEENYYHMERRYRSYARSVDIPFKVQSDKIKAVLKDGLLTVRLPKAIEAQQRKIKIEVS